VLWQNLDELISYLSDEFGLPNDDERLAEIAAEAVAEAQYRDRAGSVCTQNDGCPACVYTLLTPMDSLPHRSIGWNIVRQLMLKVTTAEWGHIAAQAPGPIVWTNSSTNRHHALVF
jgi:hypothetical protein